MNNSKKIFLAVALLLVAVAAFIVYCSSTVFLQLFLAFALAYLLNPAVGFLEGKGIRRIPGILMVFSAALVICVAVVLFFVASLGEEFSSIQLNLPDYANHLFQIVPAAVKARLGVETPDKLALRLDEITRQAQSLAPDIARPLLNLFQEALSSTVAFILALVGYFIIPVYLFYFLVDLPRLKEFSRSFIPERHRDVYDRKLGEIDAVLRGFIRGQLSVCAILAVLYSVGLSVIGIDLAVAIGVLAGIIFLIPYAGTIVGISLSLVMALLKFHDIRHPLLCVGWFCLVQILEGTVITPKMVGDSIGLHPLVAIIALLIGGEMFGIMGMLLAVPTTAVLQVFLRSLTAWYRESAFYRGV